MAGGLIRVRLLGPVEAVRDGVALPLGGPRQRALLALLALARDSGATVDALAHELWHGDPPPGFRTTMRSYVSRLRQSLGESAVQTTPGSGYRLALPVGSVDVDDFERLIRAGDESLAAGGVVGASTAFAEALELWRGPALGHLGEEGLLHHEATRLDDLRLHALEQRLEADIARGWSTRLVEEVEDLVRAHPFREQLWRLLMLALYHSNRQAEALEAYRRARRALASELGVEPSPALRDLEEAVLNHRIPPVGGGTHRPDLPVAGTSFVGRAVETAELGPLVDECRLVTLTGIGGVGKTRLAIEVAEHALARSPGALAYCDLAALGRPDLVAPTVAEAVGVQTATSTDPVEDLVDTIGAREVLVLLDNCEHVRAACAELVAELARRCPGLRVIATSRVPLGVPDEVEYPVPPMSLWGAASRPGPGDAVELFLARARWARPQLRDDDAAVACAAGICADLDGIPLAIELAAARAAMLQLDEIAARIADRFRFLVSWRTPAPARHQTLEAAMDWSFALLSERERAGLARLSVFPAGFTVASAAALCFDDDEPAAFDEIDRLGTASLLTADMSRTTTRYRMLETVRQYAGRRLDDRGETSAMRSRHAHEVLAFALRSREDQDRHMDRWADGLSERRADLRAALEWSRTGDPGLFVTLVRTVWQLWWVRGDLVEGRTWTEAALACADRADPIMNAGVLEGAAGLAWARGDLETARVRATAALTLYEDLEDPRGIGGSLMILGHVALAADEDHAAAERYFERSLAVQDGHGLEAGAAVAVHNLGSVALDTGDLVRAEHRYAEARARYTAIGDDYGVALCDLYLGLAAAEAGDAGSAARALAAALPVFRSMRFRQYTAQCVDGAAAVARARDADGEAALLLAAADALREQAGLSPTVSERLRTRERAAVRARLGDTAFAARWEEGRALSEEDSLDRAQAVLDV